MLEGRTNDFLKQEETSEHVVCQRNCRRGCQPHMGGLRNVRSSGRLNNKTKSELGIFSLT